MRAAEEMRAKKMIPMHFGCFDLSDEPVMEPIENLIELSRMNKPRVQIEIKKIGEFVPL